MLGHAYRFAPGTRRRGQPGGSANFRPAAVVLNDNCSKLVTRMINNSPVKTLVHKDLTIEGYSRAAVQTYWRVPELKLGFDFGAQPWSFMGTPTWFVSHTHLDHVAALPVYVARRRMMKMEPPTIYLPEAAVEPVQRILKLFTRLDRGRLPCQLVATRPGDEIEISREHVVTVSATRHTVPSLGFVVWERRRKLKAEYQQLSGEQIRDLRLGGTEVTEERRLPRLAYLGDSAPDGLDSCPAMFEAQVLITELTFVAPGHRKEKIHKFGHMHLDDLLARRERFKNELIVAAHFSTRYHVQQIRHIVGQAVPDMLDGRLHLWL
jgi:ribonuclease Z